MTEHPCLLLDSYRDAVGGARNLIPALGERPYRVVRTLFDDLPNQATDFSAILLTGSAASLLEAEPAWSGLDRLLQSAYQEGVPTLGICFGHQAIARALHGPQAVEKSPTGELGWLPIEQTAPDPLWAGLPPRFLSFVSHYDQVVPGQPGLQILAQSDRCPVHAFAVEGRPMWGIQFHPEMGAVETEEVVRKNLARHPIPGTTVDDLLQARVGTEALFQQLMTNFSLGHSMKSFLVVSLLASFALLEAQTWHPSIAEGLTMAQKSGQPLLVVFRCEP